MIHEHLFYIKLIVLNSHLNLTTNEDIKFLEEIIIYQIIELPKFREVF